MRIYKIKLEMVQGSRRWQNSMIFPNQTKFGLEFSWGWQWSSIFSKPIWIWFGICVLQNHFFLSIPNWNWFGKLYAIFGCNFSKPNWIWFGKGHWIKCSSRTSPKSSLVTSQVLGLLMEGRLEICRDRRDRRSCKIFPNCVKFWGNNATLLGNCQVIYALNE